MAILLNLVKSTCCLHRGPFMSENRSFGSQAVRPKVGTSANSALIRYYLPRLKLSIALFSRKRGNERLVLKNTKISEKNHRIT